MKLTFCLKIFFITFVSNIVSAQNKFFHLAKEDAILNDDDNVLPASNTTTDSQTSCFIGCSNDIRCCYIQIMQLVDKWVCSFFSAFINLEDTERHVSSDIYSVADKEKCVRGKNCLDWYQLGFKTDGVYNIIVNRKVTKVFCDMTKEGGGWTVFQRRIDGSVDFQRTWDEYKKGFGDPDGEYWLGNELIHQMTKYRRDVLVRIKATNFQGVTKYIIFKGFWIEDEKQKYKLNAGVYQIGESLLAGDWTHHDGERFTTKDQDNDKRNENNCALYFGGGWWHDNCFNLNPNSYYSATEEVAFGKGLNWRHWQGYKSSLKSFSMSLK